MSEDRDFDDMPWTARFGREIRRAAREAIRSAKRWEMSSEIDDAKYELQRALAKLGAHVEKHFASGCTVLEAAQPETSKLLADIAKKRQTIAELKARLEEMDARAREEKEKK